MPATSRSGRALAPPLVGRSRRLALEVDDHHIVLHDQHLAEVVVAVDARLDGPERGSTSASIARQARVTAPAEQRRASSRRLGNLVRPSATACKGALGHARARRPPPRATSSRVDRLHARRPGRPVGVAKASVQLGRAPAEIARRSDGSPRASPRALGISVRQQQPRRRARASTVSTDQRPAHRPGCARSACRMASAVGVPSGATCSIEPSSGRGVGETAPPR